MFSVILWVYCDDKDTSLLGASLINVYYYLEIPNLLLGSYCNSLDLRLSVLNHYVISQDEAVMFLKTMVEPPEPWPLPLMFRTEPPAEWWNLDLA